MKRLLALLFAFSMLVGFNQPLAGQDIPRSFVVTKGTTAWDLSARVYGNPFFWEDSIFKPNVAAGYLKLSDKFVRDKKTIVNLAVGQVLILRSGAVQMAPDVLKETDPSMTVSAVPVTVVEKTPWWMWMFFVVVVVMLAVGWAYSHSEAERMKSAHDREREGRQRFERESAGHAAHIASLECQLDLAQRVTEPAERMTLQEVRAMAVAPVTLAADAPDGPAFIRGGIVTGENLGLALQRSAQLDYARVHFHELPPHHSTFRFRNGTEERGIVVSGMYTTYFSDGTQRVRTITAEDREHPVVWRARVVNPDGSEALVYTEEVCANGMVTPITGDNFVWVAMPIGEQLQRLPESVIAPEPVATPHVANFRTVEGNIVSFEVPVGAILVSMGPLQVNSQSTQDGR